MLPACKHGHGKSKSFTFLFHFLVKENFFHIWSLSQVTRESLKMIERRDDWGSQKHARKSANVGNERCPAVDVVMRSGGRLKSVEICQKNLLHYGECGLHLNPYYQSDILVGTFLILIILNSVFGGNWKCLPRATRFAASPPLNLSKWARFERLWNRQWPLSEWIGWQRRVPFPSPESRILNVYNNEGRKSSPNSYRSRVGTWSMWRPQLCTFPLPARPLRGFPECKECFWNPKWSFPRTELGWLQHSFCPFFLYK